MNYVPRWMEEIPKDLQDVIKAARHYALSPYDMDFHLQQLAISWMATKLDSYEREELRRASRTRPDDETSIE